MSLDKGELEVRFDNGDTTSFVPLSFHFHSPSENTINGKHFDLEMHIVHKNKHTGHLGAVVTIFFDTIDGGPTGNQFIAELAPELALEQKLSENNSNVNGHYKVDNDVKFA